MSDEDEPVSLEHDPPEEPPELEAALRAIGHETRARIVIELGAASDGPTDFDGLPYTTLMDRVGAEDSGRFNYHLDQLVGVLVTKEDDGYWLAVNGHRVYQALVSGTLTGDVDLPSFDRDRECPECASALEVGYHLDQVFLVRCPDCDAVVQHLEFPARGVDERDPAAAYDAAIRYFNGQFAALRRGVCPACAGRVETDLLLPADDATLANLVPDAAAFATLDCLACSLERIGTPNVVALTTPPVVGFLDHHGIDPYGVDYFELEELTGETTVFDDVPVSAAVTVAVDGDRLRVVLDDSLSVVEARDPG